MTTVYFDVLLSLKFRNLPSDHLTRVRKLCTRSHITTREFISHHSLSEMLLFKNGNLTECLLSDLIYIMNLQRCWKMIGAHLRTVVNHNQSIKNVSINPSILTHKMRKRSKDGRFSLHVILKPASFFPIFPLVS